MNKELIICVGISGSGKSTWTTEYVKNNPGYLRINRDDIRKTLVGNLTPDYYKQKNLSDIENLINTLEYSMFWAISRKFEGVIIDNTNLKSNYINKWVEAVDNFNQIMESSEAPQVCRVKFKLFDCTVDIAKERVYMRERGLQKVLCNILLHKERWSKDETLKYIDKQYNDYQLIKKTILEKYPTQILE